MASTTEEKLVLEASEIPSCPLCDNSYDLTSHQPKILPCFHTFCVDCLDKIIKGENLSCPNCRRITSVPPGRSRGFLVNYSLMTSLGQVPVESSGEPVPVKCDICTDEPGLYRCLECEQFLCEEDKKRHLKFAMSREHHVDALSPDQLTSTPIPPSMPAICPIHNLEMRYLCTRDDSIICTDCFAYSHHGHPCLPINEAFEAEQHQISKLVEDASAKANKYRKAGEDVDATIKAVGEVEGRVEAELRLYFEKVRDAITARETKLLTDLKSITKQKEAILKEQRRLLTSTEISISTSCSQIQELLKQNSKGSALIMKRMTVGNLDAIAKVNTPCDPEVTADVHFLADEKLPVLILETGLVSVVSTSPAHTVADGDGLVAGRPNHLTTFEISAKDNKNKQRTVGGDTFVVEAKDYKLDAKIIDHRDGKYTVTYTCPQEVKEVVVISVLLRGKHIAKSPFHVKVHKEVEGKFCKKWGSYGHSEGQLNGPIGLAIDKNYVYVSDHCNDQIQIFNRDGRYIRKIGTKGNQKGELAYPWGVAVDDEGCVYVSDHRNKRVQVFAKDGSFLRFWPIEGTCAGLSISGGFLFVSENTNHQIHVFTKGGTFVRKWGEQGSLEGQFLSPYALTVDESHVFVADRDNHRIQVFSKDGTFLKTWGEYGTQGDGFFNGPIGVAVDNEFVYVSDQNHYIQVFTKDGRFVRKWAGPMEASASAATSPTASSSSNGYFDAGGSPLNAFGLAVDGGLLYVADYSNHRIQVFK